MTEPSGDGLPEAISGMTRRLERVRPEKVSGCASNRFIVENLLRWDVNLSFCFPL